MAGGYKQPFLDIYQTPRDRNTWRMVTKELAARMGSLYRMVAYGAATDLHEEILNGLPSGPDYKELRDGLKVEEIAAGKKGRSAAYAVHISSRARKVRKIDLGKTVIYVRGKGRQQRTSKDIQILEDNGPWTPDTIPFWPKKSEAIVIQRKVSKREAEIISKARKADVEQVRNQLADAGRKVKKPRLGQDGPAGRKGKAVPDIAMQALSLEFGEGGGRARPLWRRGVSRLRGGGLKRLPKKYSDIESAIHDPNSKRWKSWPPKGPKMSRSEASKFAAFQKRLGY